MGKKIVRKLTETKVTHVSLVKNPANEESFLLLKGAGDSAIQLTCKAENIFKKIGSEPERIVYGIVYSPNKLDADGEFMSAEDIRKSAHDFIANFRNIDGEHDFIEGLGTPVESFVAPSDMTVGERVVKNGSWVLAVKCTEEAWEKVEKGEFTGFSLAGKTIRKEVEVDVDENGNVLKSVVKSVLNALGFIQKDFNKEVENAENNNIWLYLDLLQNAIADVYWDKKTPEEMKSEIKTSVEQFLDKLSGMSFVRKDVSVESVEIAKALTELQGVVSAVQKAQDELVEKFSLMETKVENIDVIVEKSIAGLEVVVKKINNVEKATMESAQIAEEVTPVTKKKSFNGILGGFVNE